MTRIELARPQIQPTLLRCQDHPQPPDWPVTDVEYDAYVIDLAAAGDDCRCRLSLVREVIEGQASADPACRASVAPVDEVAAAGDRRDPPADRQPAVGGAP